MCKELEKKAKFYGVTIVDFDFPPSIRYAYHNGVLGINKNIVDVAMRRCIIAFGIGRHLLSNNKCITYTDEQSDKIALHWAVSTLMPFNAFVEAKRLGLYATKEIAEFMKVTPDFLEKGVEFYKAAYGSRILYQDYIIDLENKRIESLKEVG